MEFCASFAGSNAEEDGAPYNILTYKVAGKKFAYFKTSEPEQWRFSIRVSPDRFLELTDQAGVKPARYMGRFHWVTIIDVNAFPEQYLRQLIKASYTRAVESLPKYRQRQLASKG
ncbi:MAG: hypothetical protein DHS20C11_24690 [Lysobacteraceae bacterium]|nr:MAG: hypothetical protein DHS20C11_24690 [Xanthomonadaceae bacterium]